MPCVETPSPWRWVFSPKVWNSSSGRYLLARAGGAYAETSCLGARGGRKLSTQSLTVRSNCCGLSLSSPRQGSSVSSELELAFNLEMKFPERQDFYFCTCPGYFWTGKEGMETCLSSPCSSMVMLRCFRLILHCRIRLQMAICSPRQVPEEPGRPPHPFPMWLCGSACSHYKQGDQSLSWKASVCCGHHLLWPESCFVPALSKAISKHYTFLHFVMFLDTPSSSLDIKPSQHWPQTAVKRVSRISCSIFWTVCSLTWLVFTQCSWQKAVLQA